MKITEKVLLAMGASKPAFAVPSYTLCIMGQTFTINKRKKAGCWFFKRIHEFSESHRITDVEEMIGIAFGEGVAEGRADVQRDMKRLIGIPQGR